VLAARHVVVGEAEETMTFGDAALKEKALANLPTDAKIEKTAW
jgi:hypothetical protein